MKQPTNPRHGLSDLQMNELCQAYQRGETIRGVARLYSISPWQAKTILDRHGIQVRCRSQYDQFHYDTTFFSSINTEAKAYFLGLMYADGFVDANDNGFGIQLKAEDADILSIMSRLIALGADITRPFTAMNDEAYGRALLINSATLRSDLIRHGCVPTKTFKIRLPQLPVDMMHHFLRGYFDGDGCFHIGNGRSARSEKRATFKVVSCTAFCEDVAAYMKVNHNIYLGVYHPSSNPNVAAYQTGNDETIKAIYRLMYDDATVFMPRKKALFDQFFRIRCIDPHDVLPETKNRRRSFTDEERLDRQATFAAREMLKS